MFVTFVDLIVGCKKMNEKKYIDADSLKAEFTGNFVCEYPAPLVKALIDNQPAADVAEIVRCKDCALRKTEDCAMYYECDCGAQCSWETDNDYCSFGRKEGQK